MLIRPATDIVVPTLVIAGHEAIRDFLAESAVGSAVARRAA